MRAFPTSCLIACDISLCEIGWYRFRDVMRVVPDLRQTCIPNRWILSRHAITALWVDDNDGYTGQGNRPRQLTSASRTRNKLPSWKSAPSFVRLSILTFRPVLLGSLIQCPDEFNYNPKRRPAVPSSCHVYRSQCYNAMQSNRRQLCIILYTVP
jgi:hypothetical protein